ncbi:MAG: hypothetical protein ACE5LU_06235 [Anaerolineae bacterium]
MEVQPDAGPNIARSAAIILAGNIVLKPASWLRDGDAAMAPRRGNV